MSTKSEIDTPEDKTPALDTEFLFRDEEFDGQEFDAAQFVARYRRVTTLESLREQLVQYNQHVRRQLYAIINRDYKDFITITTKLDGLDTRTEMMIKPLFGLQLDLSSLQNGISGSLHLIQDKLDQQKEVLQKKAAIQKLLRVSSNMELAKSALNITQQPTLQSTSQGTAPVSRRNALYRQRNIPHDSQERDLFVCSEYERAAIALRESNQDLTAITQDLSLLHGAVAPQLVSDLQRSFVSVTDNLVSHLRTFLEHAFSSAATQPSFPSSSSSSSSSSSTGVVAGTEESTGRDLSARCYAHCLRALWHLQRSDVAEHALRTAVIEPYLRNLITPGKIDGKAGRGTYSGLEATLEEYITWLDKSRLSHYLSLAESNVITLAGTSFSSSSSASSSSSQNTHSSVNGAASSADSKPALNLVFQGLWVPLQTLLQERFPSMTSVGLTTVFSRCFRALDQFLRHLQQRFPLSFTHSVFSVAVDHHLKKFWSTWKTELYLQLRAREVLTRSDALCTAHVMQLSTGKVKPSGNGQRGTNNDKGLLELAYRPAQSSAATSPVNQGDVNQAEGGSQSHQRSALQAPLSLDSDSLSMILSTSSSSSNTAVGGSNKKWADDFYRSLVVETRILLHPEVQLRPLRTALLSLVFRVLQRLSWHVAFLCHASTLSLPETQGGSSASAASAFDSLRHEYLANQMRLTTGTGTGTGTTASTSAGVVSGTSTPATPLVGTKTSGGAISGQGTPVVPSSTTATTSSTPVPLPTTLETIANSVDDLLGHLSELVTVHQEVHQVLQREVTPWFVTPEAEQSEAVNVLVQQVIEQGLRPLTQVAVAVWRRILHLVVTDARRPLFAGVKSIAGKYRMTNKPPPTQPSAYVATVAEPWEKLLSQSVDTVTHSLYLLAVKQLQSQEEQEEVTVYVQRWRARVITEVVECFHEQVVTLLETVRQMDEALQRRQRSANASTAVNNTSSNSSGTANLSDSEKIHLQVKLDVEDLAVRALRFLRPTPTPSNGNNGHVVTAEDQAWLQGEVPAFQTLWSILKQQQ